MKIQVYNTLFHNNHSPHLCLIESVTRKLMYFILFSFVIVGYASLDRQLPHHKPVCLISAA